MPEWVCSQKRLNSSVLIGKASKIWPLKDDIKDKLNKKMPIIEEKALLNSKLIGQLLHSFADEKKQRGAYSENGLYTDAN